MAVTDPSSDGEPLDPSPTKTRRRRFAMPVDPEPSAATDRLETDAEPTDGRSSVMTDERAGDEVSFGPGPAVGEPAVTADASAEIETPDEGTSPADESAAAQPMSAPSDESGQTDDAAAAFRDVHERRLHGFALLLMLGNRATAAELTRAALDDAQHKVNELAHPERGAVWLRRHVLRHAPKRTEGGGRGPFRRSRPAPHSPGGIGEIGADEVLVEALARLDLQSRAALILQDVERFREVDVADALGTDLRAVERLVREARTKYSQAYTAAAARHGMADSMELPEDVRRSADRGLPRHE